MACTDMRHFTIVIALLTLNYGELLMEMLNDKVCTFREFASKIDREWKKGVEMDVCRVGRCSRP
jgi:hypothetical protein